MKSKTLPSFWKAYENLDPSIKRQTRKAYSIWRNNPYHPSLHFKCINVQDNIWSVRVTRNYRALGIVEGDTMTWLWIGGHDAYRRFFS
ncbi:type II toxin-antitoxin system RelE family toxin [Candidatus Promineifilum breve]|uniref:type II toxin-antitoxin system RelE family toxin n=1 Tax=Candidatus Promineifilum breve TaxID=1806508 RepID=UPI0007C1A585|nr:hypothetical protein [Candidatus Promineifilum breve]